MSISLCVKLGNNTIPKRVLYDYLLDKWKSIVLSDVSPIFLDRSEGNLSFGGKQDYSDIIIDDEAGVRCLCYFAGAKDVSNENSGWWLDISVTVRTEESILLLAITSACFAEIASTNVADDANIMHLGISVKPARIFQIVSSIDRLNLSNAASEICKIFGISFSR